VDTFKIEFELGQSVLGLQMVRQDSSLAFRFSCINANACKECMMLIDGEVEYACTVRLKEGTTNGRAVAEKTLIRDPVMGIAPPDERLERSPQRKMISKSPRSGRRPSQRSRRRRTARSGRCSATCSLLTFTWAAPNALTLYKTDIMNIIMMCVINKVQSDASLYDGRQSFSEMLPVRPELLYVLESEI
jgi:succinate dehydrogenase/fumarate reductase-like Fe-S protein